MADLSPDEKDRIIKARDYLDQQRLFKEEAEKKAAQERKNRIHGKLLSIASYTSLIFLIVYSLIIVLLSLRIVDENFFDVLKTFYFGIVKFLLFNLSSNQGLISVLSGLMTVGTFIAAIALSSSANYISKQNIEKYKEKRVTIIFYMVFLFLCASIIFTAMLSWPNPLSISGIALLIGCIVLAVIDMIRAYKQ